MNSITIDFTRSKGVIAPELYGHFSEHIGGVMYDGLWLNGAPRCALLEKLKAIGAPVLRWPGGCFAETYDWRDGVGPREKRPLRAGWWYINDRRMETNEVGTHEFMSFCRLSGAKPYFAANLTTVSPLHIRNWIEYCNFPAGTTTLARERGANGDLEPFGVQYWGLGNENWGGGGRMSPGQYARAFRAAREICDNVDLNRDLRFIACGPGVNNADTRWTTDFMNEYYDLDVGSVPPWGLSMHYYCGFAGDPLAFSEDEWYEMLFKADRMGALIDKNRLAMDIRDPKRKVKLVVDEWGCWHPDGSGPSKGCNLFEQQSTARDAAVAGLTLNAFNERCDVVGMANVAQLVNNLHALFLTHGDQMTVTPTYHVFDLFKPHMGGRQLCVANGCGCFERAGYDPLPRVSASASMSDAGATVTLVNTSLNAQTIRIGAAGGALAGKALVRMLDFADPHDVNDFEHPDRVRIVEREIDFVEGDAFELPAARVAAITFREAKTL